MEWRKDLRERTASKNVKEQEDIGEIQVNNACRHLLC